MKMRVVHAKKRYKDRVYTTPLLMHSYRDENGTPRHKTILNLSSPPAHAIDALDRALREDGSPTVSLDNVQYEKAVPFGHIAAVSHLAGELGRMSH